MKKRIPLFVLAVAIATPFVAMAQNSDEMMPPEAIAAQQRINKGVKSIPTPGSINGNNKGDLQAERQQNQEQRKQNIQQRCQNISNNLQNGINRYENNLQMNNNVFGRMQTRLERLEASLAEKGLDTTKLKQDLAILKEKIAKLKTDNEAFIASLKETHSVACDQTGETDPTTQIKGQFREKLMASRKVGQTSIADRLDIKNFFLTTIKADLMAIRSKIKETTQTQTQTQTQTTQENQTTTANPVQ